MYCCYYQATVNKKTAWFLSGCFRNEDHLAFVRAMHGSSDEFEFFVPEEQEDRFLALVSYLQKNGYILTIEKKENRLKAGSL